MISFFCQVLKIMENNKRLEMQQKSLQRFGIKKYPRRKEENRGYFSKVMFEIEYYVKLLSIII